MLKIDDLPNELTELDSKKIAKIKLDKDLTLKLYNGKMHYTVLSYDEKKDTYKVTNQSMSINSFVEDCIQENISILSASILSFTPLCDMFKGFKSELIIVPLYNGEDLNIENPFIAECLVDISDFSIGTFVIYEKTTGAYLFYMPNEKHKFKVPFKEDDNFEYFESLDLALKFPFEFALEKDYKTQKLREIICEMNNFFETPEGIQSIKDFSIEIEESNKERELFISSGLYNKKLIELEKTFKENKIESISSHDFHYLSHLLTFIKEDHFNLMVDISIENGDVTANEDLMFDNEQVRVGDLIFSRMYGQGTVKNICYVGK